MENDSIVRSIQLNSKLLNIIRCFDKVDRNLLCNSMNLSWPTIQKDINKLKENGVLENKPRENGDTKLFENKNKEEFSINPSAGYYVGISIGGSQIKISIVDMAFNIVSTELFNKIFIEKYSFFSNLEFTKCDDDSSYGYFYKNTPFEFFELQSTVNLMMDEIIRLNENLKKNNQYICGIGIAFTGAVNHREKKLIETFSLDCFNNLPLKYDSLIYPDKIAYCMAHDINISFDNIAKAAIVSEKFSLYNSFNPNNRYENSKNLACIYLGSGVGGALVLDNRLYRGTSNFSELGHIEVIDPDFINEIDIQVYDEACTCGCKNCLEYKIRNNVFGMSMKEFKKYTATRLREEFLKKPDVELRMKLLAHYIGQAIKIITNIMNVDLIILTGKLTRFMDKLEKYLYEEKSKNSIGYTNSDCSLVVSTYGALAPSAGAAMLSSIGNNEEQLVWF